jgi:hypothetical protein
MPRGRRLYRQSFDTLRRDASQAPHRFAVWLQLSGIDERLAAALWDALCRAKHPTAQQICGCSSSSSWWPTGT